MGELRRTVWDRLNRAIARPSVTITLLGFLVAVVTCADWFTWETLRSRQLMHRTKAPHRKTISPLPRELFAIKHRGQVLVLDPNNDSYDETTKAIAESPGEIAVLTTRAWSILDGILGRTSERWTLRIDQQYGSAFSPEDWHEARAGVIKLVYGPEAIAVSEFARLAKEDFTVARILWSGYIPNTLVILIAAALVPSVRWVLPAVEKRRERKRARILRAHRCPSCGYSTLGLRVSVCPECGDHLRVKRNDPGTEPGS